MASGSQNMTTYNARIVTGSNSAASPEGALLLSGTGRADDATGDTWIFLNSLRGTTNPWGIKHDQANNKLQIFGSGTNSVSVRMNTGDTYILGKVGIGYNPETSGNTYKLYVNGTGYFTDTVSFAQGLKTGSRASDGSGAGIEIGADGGIEIFHTSTPFIDFHYQASTSDYSVRLICDSETNLGCKGSFTATNDIHANGGYLKSTANGNTIQIGAQNSGCCHIYNSADIPFAFNRGFLMVNSGDIGSSSYPTGNIIVKSGGRISGNSGNLYLGNSENQGWVYIQDMCSQDGQKWKIHQNGNAEFNGTVTAPTFSGNATSATYLKDKTNGTASYLNYGRSGITSASDFTWLSVWNGYSVEPASKAAVMEAVRGAASGSWSISITGNAATASKVGEAASWLYFHHSNEVNFGGTNTSTTIYFGYRAVDSRGKPTDFVFGSGSGTANVKAAKVYNAVWNDYAEYRCGEITEGGYCVIETSNGLLQKTTKRLQPACHLTSDTWGTIMGETKDAKTPIAVAGRVLAYPYRAREHYHLGDALCSAPGGTVDIMTREEIREYPERIVGIVSEIPNYEIWHAGAQDGDHEIQVNGRIWIYVR